jgi:YbbR domain-containing protein
MQFLVALIAAFLLWYVLAAERSENISVRGVPAPVEVVNIPGDLELMSPVPDTVLLQLKGNLSILDPRSPPQVLIDLFNAVPGQIDYLVTASTISLPDEIEVINANPESISLELERVETRQVPVRPAIAGVPAPGFVIGEVRAIPAQVAIQGPVSLLLDLEFVETTLISIEDASGPIEALVEPLTPDPLLRPVGIGPIQVVVDIMPEVVPEEQEEAVSN